MEKEDRRANVCRRNSPGPGQEAQERKILSLCVYTPGATGTSRIFFFLMEYKLEPIIAKYLRSLFHLTLRKML